jgi:hypothetical protein
MPAACSVSSSRSETPSKEITAAASTVQHSSETGRDSGVRWWTRTVSPRDASSRVRDSIVAETA